ncbi:MAG: cytochrome c oxidase subunit 3 [Rhodococcus sp. (in: high G+C Gram-positive bacteria)]|uniref:cytochrome c oxidase subunit 3 n=1 Tax=Rhodococcus sp. TaxID=1831 RepID=UPI003BB130B3
MIPATGIRSTDSVEPRAPETGRRIPGEAELWIFILGDLTVFAGFFIAYLWALRENTATFVHDSAELLIPLGLINTVVLLTSSYLVLMAVHHQRGGCVDAARRLLDVTLAGAGVFIACKTIEYALEVASGHGLASSEFFMYYFVLTGLHLLHVAIGSVLLLVWRRSTVAGRQAVSTRFAEGAAVYWHMVDLLWVIIFTLLYLGSPA